jgi:hypothetical protein
MEQPDSEVTAKLAIPKTATGVTPEAQAGPKVFDVQNVSIY